MSHGFAACAGHIVNDLESWMNELGLSHHYNSLHNLLSDAEQDFDYLQEVLSSDPVQAIDKKILRAYQNLQAAFEFHTGLRIAAGYHCPDNGDTFDQVSGFYWYLDGVTQFTPAAEKVKDKFQEKFWVYYNQ